MTLQNQLIASIVLLKAMMIGLILYHENRLDRHDKNLESNRWSIQSSQLIDEQYMKWLSELEKEKHATKDQIHSLQEQVTALQYDLANKESP